MNIETTLKDEGIATDAQPEMSKLALVPQGLDRCVHNRAIKVFFVAEDGDYRAIAFTTRKKSTFYFKFRSEEKLLACLRSRMESAERSLTKREAQRKERRSQQSSYDAREEYQVGDIIAHTWGYEQTQVDFYRVDRVTKRQLTTTPLKSHVQSSGELSMTGRASPGDPRDSGEPVLFYARVSGIGHKYGSVCKHKKGETHGVSWYG